MSLGERDNDAQSVFFPPYKRVNNGRIVPGIGPQTGGMSGVEH